MGSKYLIKEPCFVVELSTILVWFSVMTGKTSSVALTSPEILSIKWRLRLRDLITPFFTLPARDFKRDVRRVCRKRMIQETNQSKNVSNQVIKVNF